MKTRKISSQSHRFNPALFWRSWAGKLVTASILLVLIATLPPLNFTPTSLSLRAAIYSFFLHPSSLKDFVGNVILFLPLGVGLGCLARQQGVNRLGAVLIGSAVSSALSLTVETLQVFLPSRSSSVIDVFTNTTGGFLGAIGFLIWQAIAPNQALKLTEILKRWASKRTLAVAIVLWVMFTISIIVSLQQAATFNNWNTTFPLILGNERTGDRPWTGTIANLEISDRASSPSEVSELFQHQGFAPQAPLIAAYSFNGQGSYRDRTGHLPDLIWLGESQPSEEAVLTSKRWLSTQKPATVLTEKLKETSEFTLSTIVATSDANQAGPARIISLSTDSFERNFTLGQEKTDLVFRLRTQITGMNGTKIALSVPGVFRDTKPHHLVLTYQRQTLTLYVDNVQKSRTLNLTPDITLFRYLFPFEGSRVDLNRVNVFVYTTLFDVTFFVPLGFLTAFIMLKSKGSFGVYVFLFVSGIIIPVALLESLMKGSELKLTNLMMSVAIATLPLLFVKARVSTQPIQ